MSWEAKARFLGLSWETVSRNSSGKFLRAESSYPESFGFLRLCWFCSLLILILFFADTDADAVLCWCSSPRRLSFSLSAVSHVQGLCRRYTSENNPFVLCLYGVLVCTWAPWSSCLGWSAWSCRCTWLNYFKGNTDCWRYLPVLNWFENLNKVFFYWFPKAIFVGWGSHLTGSLDRW